MIPIYLNFTEENNAGTLGKDNSSKLKKHKLIHG